MSHRCDLDQCARRLAQDYFSRKDDDFYQFEAHVFFDDAMETVGGRRVLNEFVITLIRTVGEATRWENLTRLTKSTNQTSLLATRQ